MDVRRFAIIAVIATFMLVTVGHVAAYAGSFEAAGWQWLGWPYALAVDAAIVLSAFSTRYTGLRKVGWAGYAAFVAASGVMNAGQVQPWERVGFDAVTAFTYALFPTGAIALLGFLFRAAEESLHGAQKYRLHLPAFLRRSASQQSQPVAVMAQSATHDNGHEPLVCPACGATATAEGKPFRKSQQVSAHMRFCTVYQAQEVGAHG